MAQFRPTSTGSDPTDRVTTGRRRSFAALAAGTLLATAATVTPSLLSGSGASAATVLQGKTWYDLNKNGVQDATNNAQTNETAIAGVPVFVTAKDGSAETAVSSANGTWSVTMQADGPYRVEFGTFPQPCPAGVPLPCVVKGPSVGGTTVQFPGTGQTTVNLGVFAKFNGLGSLEALTAGSTVEVGDRVWEDTNSNGIQDPGEPGIAGVTVNLIDSFPGNPTGATTTTDANGYYLFTKVQDNLPYTITVDSADPKLVGYALTQGGQGNRAIDSDPFGLDPQGLAVANVPLRNPDENDHTFDFGWVPPVLKGGLGDRVWLDTNANGIQDEGENGIEGAIVKLLDKDGNPVAEQATDSSGLYLFTNLDTASQYIVECQAPPEFEGVVLRSPANQGTNDETDSDADVTTGRTGLNSVPAGGNNLSVDCGWYVKPDTRKATLGDYVFIDTNRNGIQDEGDTAVTGATVTLLDNAGNPISGVAPIVTGADGLYLFTGLNAGTYRIRVVKPTGSTVTPTLQNQGSNDGADSDINADGLSDAVTLAAGEDIRTLDAGWVTPVQTPKYKLGDRLFDDLNSNGIQDANEPGIVGQLVELLNANGTVIASQNTIADGRYTFDNLDAATYRVRFTAPAGRTFTTKDAGTDEGLDSDVNPSGLTDNIVLVADNFNVDAGVLPAPVSQKLKLGDRLFDDLNSNGIQDANEPGIVGAKVELLDANGGVLATQNTIADGRYTFFELNPGQYRVRFTAPAGRSFSPRFAGTDRGLDSNVDGNGLSDLITLSSDDLTIDAGVVPVPTTVPPTVVPPTTAPPTTSTPPTTTKAPGTFCLGDKVFVDPGSAGGAQAKDGAGIPGVTLTLIRPDGSTAITATDVNGNYTFCGLAAGTYTVKVDTNTLPKGSTNTYDLDGDRNNETRVAATTDNPDLDFGYIYPVVVNTVMTAPPATLPPTPPVDTPTYTGSESTQRALLALSMLLVGFGLLGLARGRRCQFNG